MHLLLLISEEFQEFQRQLKRAQTAKEQLNQIIHNQVEKKFLKVKKKLLIVSRHDLVALHFSDTIFLPFEFS